MWSIFHLQFFNHNLIISLNEYVRENNFTLEYNHQKTLMKDTSSSSSVVSLPIATMIHMVTIKLSYINFFTMERQVVPIFTSFELLGFVNSKELTPQPTVLFALGEFVPNPYYTKWFSTTQCLLGVLFSTLSEEAMTEMIRKKVGRC